MNKQQIALKLIVSALGLDFSVSTFDDRLILQKGVYLAQAGGSKLGYRFSWYLYGPYCSELASDAFAISDDIKAGCDESDGWQLDSGTIRELGNIGSLIKDSPVTDPARSFELMASVHFLIDRKGMDMHDHSTLRMTLENFRKHYSENEVKAAAEGLAKHGFIKK